MIDAEAVAAESPAPEQDPTPPWFYPVAPSARSTPVSRLDRLAVALRIRLRLWWTRLRFRLWWVHPLRQRLIGLRLRARLFLLYLTRRRLRP